MTTHLTDRYVDAVAYAAAAHAAQTRKASDVTYMCHLLSVSGSILEAGGDEDLAIAGLLHDVVEDQGGLPRLADVRARFGDRVADIVLACSDSTTAKGPKAPYDERKGAHIAKLREATDDVLLVTAADKLNNARAIHADLLAEGPEGFTKRGFTGDVDQVLRYYEGILAVLTDRKVNPILLESLRHTVGEITSILKPT